jgi:glycosyltransferase involved in cell wall biosynthesis
VKFLLSVLIMTLNEEKNIRRCIQSVEWADDIIVLDSGSTDRTREIAEELGCTVVQRKLVTWAEHQNWALRNLTFRHPWVLNVDADEIVPEDLAAEIQIAVKSNAGHVAYRFRIKDHFLGTWLKHASFYPHWLTRLYCPESVSFERLVNPVTNVDGTVGYIDAHLIHYPFSRGVSQWFDRHNGYSSLEAQEYDNRENLAWKLLFSRDKNQRRRQKKLLFSKLPCRPIVKFVYLYFIHRGFLDGRAGFYYSIMQSYYEFMISVKVVELRAKIPESPLTGSIRDLA